MRNKTPIWEAIARTLRDDLAEGHLAPGEKLPTEAQLSARFGVNRHTVRRAIADLIDQGLLRSRRGSGVFVCALPTEYPIGTRVRFHENLLAAGRTPDKRVLMIDLRAPSPGEAEILPGATRVCAYHGLSLADGQPIAVFESIFPLNWLPGIDAALGETASVTEALRTIGIADYTRHSTRLTAVQADATQAAQLFIREGAPLLRSTSLNVDSEGRPIEFGRTFFVGDRVTLTLDGE